MTGSDVLCLAAAVLAAAAVTFVLVRGPASDPFSTPLNWSTGR